MPQDMRLKGRPNIVITVANKADPEPDGFVYSGTEDGNEVSHERALELFFEHQDMNLAMARLQYAGLYDPKVDTLPWEMKSNRVNIKVPAGDEARVRKMLSGLNLTVNG